MALGRAGVPERNDVLAPLAHYLGGSFSRDVTDSGHGFRMRAPPTSCGALGHSRYLVDVGDPIRAVKLAARARLTNL